MAAIPATILLILKIIGIVIVCLLAFVILLLCLILFAPVSLRVRVKSEEAVTADGRVSWLGFVLRAVFSYEEEFDLAVKVFGVQVYPKKKKKEKRVQEEAAPEGRQAEAEEPFAEKEQPQQSSPAELTQPQETAERQPAADRHEAAEEFYAQMQPPRAEETEARQKPERKRERPAKGRPEKRGGRKKRRPRTEGGSSHGTAAGKEPGMLEKFRTLVGDEDFGYAVSKVFSELGALLGSIRVYELKGQAAFSAGSPDITGMATGALSLCPACYGKDLDLSPDFAAQEAYFRGVLSGGGSLKLYYVVTAAVRLLRDKKLKKIVHLAQDIF